MKRPSARAFTANFRTYDAPLATRMAGLGCPPGPAPTWPSVGLGEPRPPSLTAPGQVGAWNATAEGTFLEEILDQILFCSTDKSI